MIVPERGLLPELAATVYEAGPGPTLLLPAVTIIQSSLLVAFHLHPSDVVIVTVPLAPAAPTDALGGDIEKLHG